MRHSDSFSVILYHGLTFGADPHIRSNSIPTMTWSHHSLGV